MKSLRISQELMDELNALSARYGFSVRNIANRAIRKGHRLKSVVECSKNKETTYNGPILKVKTLGYSQRICRGFIKIYVDEHIDLPIPEVFMPEAKAGIDYIVQ